MAKTIFYSLASLVRKILFCHAKIKFISSRHCVISSIYMLAKKFANGLFKKIEIFARPYRANGWAMDMRCFWLWWWLPHRLLKCQSLNNEIGALFDYLFLSNKHGFKLIAFLFTGDISQPSQSNMSPTQIPPQQNRKRARAEVDDQIRSFPMLVQALLF